MLGLAQKVERLHVALTRAKLEHAFGGALALAYYATPRATVDIDVNVFVSPEEYERVCRILSKLGVDKIPPAEGVVKNGQARTWWGVTPVDVFFSCDEIHDAMRQAGRIVPFGKGSIPILAPEHLLVAKAVFNRPKDWLDIEQMLIAVDEIDASEIRRWLTHLIGNADPRATRVEDLLTRLR